MNNVKKKSILIAIVIVLILSFTTGCTTGSGQSNTVATVTVTDCIDRTVEIPEEPQRIACISSSAAHLMAMFGAEDKIVAVPNNVKTDELMKMKIDDIESLSVPMQDNDLNIEELLSIRADLVILKSNQIGGEGQKEKLEKAGIPWIVVDFFTIDELKECVSLMGNILGEEDKAASYISFMVDTIKIVEDRVGEYNDNPPNVYHSVNEAIRTDETGGICQEIMAKASVIDISADKNLSNDGNKTYATIEEIYKWNPDAIIANEYSVTEYLLSDSKWNGLDAIKERKVYTLPIGISRWCHPGSIEPHMGVLAVANIFYPEAFADFDYKSYIKDYYMEYFDIDLDNETIDNIIAGKGMRISNKPKK